jgi:hypothetical protein
MCLNNTEKFIWFFKYLFFETSWMGVENNGTRTSLLCGEALVLKSCSVGLSDQLQLVFFYLI